MRGPRTSGEKMIRRGSYNGSYAFGGAEYYSAKIDGQDGFSGSPVYNDNAEIVRKTLDAYSRRDIEALRALNHPDMELDWSASRGSLAGVSPRVRRSVALLR